MASKPGAIASPLSAHLSPPANLKPPIRVRPAPEIHTRLRSDESSRTGFRGRGRLTRSPAFAEPRRPLRRQAAAPARCGLDPTVRRRTIERSNRIGIARAADSPLRFYAWGNRSLEHVASGLRHSRSSLRATAKQSKPSDGRNPKSGLLRFARNDERHDSTSKALCSSVRRRSIDEKRAPVLRLVPRIRIG